MLFQHLTGDNAILVSNGVYRQTDPYTRRDELFAKVGTGFVRLYADGSTSHAGTRLETLATNVPLYADRLGRITCEETNRPVSVIATGTLPIEGPK